MKDTFLTDVVKQLIRSGKNIETLKLIVPSRRAVKFLKEALKNYISALFGVHAWGLSSMDLSIYKCLANSSIPMRHNKREFIR